MQSIAINRPEVPAGYLDLVLEVVKDGLKRRIQKHGVGALVGPHEIAGVLEEEMREMWNEVHGDDDARVHHELLDVAVAALFGMASLWTLERVKLPIEPRP